MASVLSMKQEEWLLLFFSSFSSSSNKALLRFPCMPRSEEGSIKVIEESSLGSSSLSTSSSVPREGERRYLEEAERKGEEEEDEEEREEEGEGVSVLAPHKAIR